MFEVEIRIKRTDEYGIYYEIVPTGELNDKLAYCSTHDFNTIDADVLIIAKEILNNLPI